MAYAPLHRDRGSRLTKAFFAAAGILGIAFGGMGLFGAASAVAHGCRLVYSQSDFTTDPAAMPSGGCEQYVDMVGIAAPILIGAILVVAVLRYGQTDIVSTAAKALAIPAGAVVGAMPLLSYWQLHSYYRLAYGPVELAVFAIGFVILALGLYAASRTASALWRSRAIESPPRTTS